MRKYRFAIYGMLILPMVVVGSIGLIKIYSMFNQKIFLRKRDMAQIAATAIHEKIERNLDLTLSLATRLRLRIFVEKKKWKEAIDMLNDVPTNFSFINRIILFDTKGILKTDFPHLSDVKGKDFSFREWYKGVSKNWKPYVSNAYRRTAEPRRNVIAIAVPIKSPKNKVVGILVNQILLENFQQWLPEVDIKEGEFIYVVDHNGQIIYHPKVDPQEEIKNYSEDLNVQKILAGQKGVGVFFHLIEKEERISAFEPVPPYGWGVIVTESTRTAFMDRNKVIIFFTIVSIIVFMVFICAVYFIEKMNNKLRIKEERFRSVVSTARDAIISADKTGNIIEWNKLAIDLFGYEEVEILGKPLTHIMPLKYRNDHIKGLHRYLNTGEAHVIGRVIELSALKKDGTEFPIEISLSSWKTEAGIFFTGIVRDISERKKMEILLKDQMEKLSLTNMELERLGKLKDEFVATVNHELRTPLTSIKAGVEMLRDEILGSVTPKQYEFLTMVDRSIDRLTALIGDMLDIAKIESGRLKLQREKLSLPDIMKNMVEAHRSAFRNRSIKIICESSLPDVFADEARLSQVITNLFSNAVKFTEETGSVLITIKNTGSMVEVSVADNGVGIDDTDLLKLFKKFSQVSHDRNKYGGTGLGLALCREIIALHKGKIGVTSQPKMGSTFYFTLPIFTEEYALNECFEEQLGLVKRGYCKTVGLVALNGAVFSDEERRKIISIIHERIHPMDDCIFLEPNTIVILSGTDDQSLSLMSQKIIEDLRYKFPSREMNSAIAIYPADGSKVTDLFQKVTALLDLKSNKKIPKRRVA